jgi:heme-degrading monooxygenase HmoA
MIGRLDNPRQPNVGSRQRIWHGWTTPANADAYEHLLRTEILPGIFTKNIPGCEQIELLRREQAEEVEFITIMTFASLESVKAFVGSDYEVAYVPPKARAILERLDERSLHYEVREVRAVSETA